MEDSRGGGSRRRKEGCEIEGRETSSSNAKTSNGLTRGPPSSSSSQSSAWNANAGVVAHHHSSAPLEIPGWSKIFMKEKMKKKLWDENASEVEREEDEEMGPPHEYLARRPQIASHSMCEGVGRTLKGRDLSKLRDAILTKTGFIE